MFLALKAMAWGFVTGFLILCCLIGLVVIAIVLWLAWQGVKIEKIKPYRPPDRGQSRGSYYPGSDPKILKEQKELVESVIKRGQEEFQRKHPPRA